ncbi:hypothetical protein AMTRI_Chr02g263360 [Amborella trichopoda]
MENGGLGTLDSFDHLKGSNALDHSNEEKKASRLSVQWMSTSCEEKKAVVHAEMERVNKLPANSSYANHRMRVLHKVLQLMSLKRTTSQDEELELLFAGLSL